MGRVAILADDLTGALDTAAPFARKESSVTVGWRKDAVAGHDAFAFDTETRDGDAVEASRRVLACLPRLASADIGFKKLDSLMRGNTLAELVACAGSGEFASVVIAPAFPEQGRFTRDGRQVVPADAEVPKVIDIARALSESRIPVRVVARGESPPDHGVALCDAETGGDLARLAGTAPRLNPPILWCGSAGLARALGQPMTLPASDLAGRRLIVVGSRHPVAAVQASRLRRRLGKNAVVLERAADAERQVSRLGDTLGAGGSCALLFAFPPLEPPAAEAMFAEALGRLAHIAPPDVLVVVGGDTLYRLCRAVGAESLAAIGEWTAGVPVSRITGGVWEGTTMISKSGAFGSQEILVRLLDNVPGDARS